MYFYPNMITFHYMLASRDFYQGTATQIHVTKSKETPRDLDFI